jgi:hypothetical protein
MRTGSPSERSEAAIIEVRCDRDRDGPARDLLRCMRDTPAARSETLRRPRTRARECVRPHRGSALRRGIPRRQRLRALHAGDRAMPPSGSRRRPPGDRWQSASQLRSSLTLRCFGVECEDWKPNSTPKCPSSFYRLSANCQPRIEIWLRGRATHDTCSFAEPQHRPDGPPSALKEKKVWRIPATTSSFRSQAREPDGVRIDVRAHPTRPSRQDVLDHGGRAAWASRLGRPYGRKTPSNACANSNDETRDRRTETIHPRLTVPSGNLLAS